MALPLVSGPTSGRRTENLSSGRVRGEAGGGGRSRLRTAWPTQGGTPPKRLTSALVATTTSEKLKTTTFIELTRNFHPSNLRRLRHHHLLPAVCVMRTHFPMRPLKTFQVQLQSVEGARTKLRACCQPCYMWNRQRDNICVHSHGLLFLFDPTRD